MLAQFIAFLFFALNMKLSDYLPALLKCPVLSHTKAVSQLCEGQRVHSVKAFNYYFENCITNFRKPSSVASFDTLYDKVAGGQHD